MVRVLANNRPEPRALQQVLFARPQMKRHTRALRRALDRLKLVFALTIRLPADALVRAESGAARGQRDAVSYHEG